MGVLYFVRDPKRSVAVDGIFVVFSRAVIRHIQGFAVRRADNTVGSDISENTQMTVLPIRPEIIDMLTILILSPEIHRIGKINSAG